MFENLERWRKNIDWLLNCPPTNVTQANVWEQPPCSYCGTTTRGREYHGQTRNCICAECIKKAFDLVLKPKKKERRAKKD